MIITLKRERERERKNKKEEKKKEKVTIISCLAKKKNLHAFEKR